MNPLTKNFIDYIDKQPSRRQFFKKMGFSESNYRHIQSKLYNTDNYIPGQLIVEAVISYGLNFYHFVDPKYPEYFSANNYDKFESFDSNIAAEPISEYINENDYKSQIENLKSLLKLKEQEIKLLRAKQ